MPTLTFHGHATFSVLTEDGTQLVVDPFFTDNPGFTGSLDDIEADYILLTHGHHDHIADAIPLAERTGATIIASYEIATYMENRDGESSECGVVHDDSRGLPDQPQLGAADLLRG
jgi:L-ascorbate metabolism protein UlaG (beta-lactamase superfamily)